MRRIVIVLADVAALSALMLLRAKPVTPLESPSDHRDLSVLFHGQSAG